MFFDLYLSDYIASPFARSSIIYTVFGLHRLYLHGFNYYDRGGRVSDECVDSDGQGQAGPPPAEYILDPVAPPS